MPVPTEKLLAANRGEIAIRIFRAATNWGCDGRHLPRKTASRCTDSRPTKPTACARQGAGRGLPGHRGHHRRRQGKGRGRDPPGLRVPLGECGVRARLPEAGITFVGPTPELLEVLGDKTAARALAARAACRRCRERKNRWPTGRRLEGRAADRLSVDHQGRVRRRRARHARRAQGQRARRSSGGGQTRGRRRLRQPRRLPRALHPRAKHIEVQILGERTATSSTSTSATARCSGVIRKWSRSRPPSGSTTVRIELGRGRAPRPGDRLQQCRHGRVPLRRRLAASGSSSR